jgi:hypothetical protein
MIVKGIEKMAWKIGLIFLTLLIVSLQGMAVADNKVTWSMSPDGNGNIGNGHIYQAVYEPGGISWQDAKAAADTMDSIDNKPPHLVTIDSPEENNFVYNLISDDKYWSLDSYGSRLGPWIGGYQKGGSSDPAGGWAWVTKEPFFYTNWGSGEPNNAKWDGHDLHVDENNVMFIGVGSSKGSTWNDYPSSSKASGYIVEWDTQHRWI